MNNLFIVAGDYLNGKSIYPTARRLLNLLFNISISSFIYEKKYGSYEWFDITDYKAILNFFIKGDFFIPFSIFVLVYAITQVISFIIFNGLTHMQSVKTTRRILEYQLNKESVDETLDEIKNYTKKLSPIDLTKENIIKAYCEIREEITPEAIQELEGELIG